MTRPDTDHTGMDADAMFGDPRPRHQEPMSGRYAGLHQGEVKDRWFDQQPATDKLLLRALALVSAGAVVVIAATVASLLEVL